MSARDAWLDEGGLLRVGDRWVAIPEGQVEVLRLLLGAANLVTDEEIAACYASAGGASGPGAIRMMLWRLGRRVAGIGLELVRVRSRGSRLVASDAAEAA